MNLCSFTLYFLLRVTRERATSGYLSKYCFLGTMLIIICLYIFHDFSIFFFHMIKSFHKKMCEVPQIGLAGYISDKQLSRERRTT